MQKATSRDDIYRIRTNVLTSWKSFSQLAPWYDQTESIALRAQLGEISPEEVSEVNRVLGGAGLDSVRFSLDKSEPALLSAINVVPAALFLGFGMGAAGIAKVARGYNNLWFIGAILPCTLYCVFNKNKNTEQIDNAYRYLIAKRAATCEHEANCERFMANEWTKTPEFQNL